MAKTYSGWSYRGRPFSKAQFNNSFLKKNNKRLTYAKYLAEYARQYKIPSLRKTL